jgi:hypothetical protein
LNRSSCDEDLDECLSYPCQNGGLCQQTEDPGNYTCTCTDEFKGHDCHELKIKTCNEFPCKNGGTCRNGPSEFVFLIGFEPGSFIPEAYGRSFALRN